MKRKKQCAIFIIIIFLQMLGFPGNYALIFGEFTKKLMTYGCFALQVFVMLYSSSEKVEEIRIIDLKKYYLPIYFVIVTFFGLSILGTHNLPSQIIRSVHFSITVLFALWLLETYSLYEILELIYWAQVVYVFSCLGLALLRPSLVYSYDEHGFRWIQDAKNGGGMILSTGASLQLMLLKERIRNKIPVNLSFYCMLILQVIMMVLANALSADLLFLIVLVYLFVVYDYIKEIRFPLGLLYVTWNVGFLIFSLTILPVFGPLLELVGKDATLTGRTIMWEHIIDFMTNSSKWLTGYGYNMFWENGNAVARLHSTYERYSWFSTMTTGSHNMLLELWLDVGIVGMGCYLLCVLLSLRKESLMTELEYIVASAFVLTIGLDSAVERALMVDNFRTCYTFLVLGIGCRSVWRHRSYYGKEQRRK